MAKSGRLRAAHARPDTQNCLWLWRAFQELQTCRAIGFGVVGPIPITAIWAYIDRYNLPEWVVDAMFSLDATWRAVEGRRRAAAPAPQPPPRHIRKPAYGE